MLPSKVGVTLDPLPVCGFQQSLIMHGGANVSGLADCAWPHSLLQI